MSVWWGNPPSSEEVQRQLQIIAAQEARFRGPAGTEREQEARYEFEVHRERWQPNTSRFIYSSWDAR